MNILKRHWEHKTLLLPPKCCPKINVALIRYLFPQILLSYINNAYNRCKAPHILIVFLPNLALHRDCRTRRIQLAWKALTPWDCFGGCWGVWKRKRLVCWRYWWDFEGICLLFYFILSVLNCWEKRYLILFCGDLWWWGPKFPINVLWSWNCKSLTNWPRCLSQLYTICKSWINTSTLIRTFVLLEAKYK